MKYYYQRYWEKEEVLSDFSYKWPVLKKLIPVKKHISILDFGCGKGVITSEIAKINPTAKLFGVDVSGDAIKFTKKKVSKITVKLISDGGRIPFPDNSFDFIIASDVLEHVYDTENAFLELSRILKKNGTILISVPYNGLLKRVIVAIFFFEDIFTAYTPHIRFFTKNTLSNALLKVGLKPFKTGYYGRVYPLSHGMYMMAKK